MISVCLFEVLEQKHIEHVSVYLANMRRWPNVGLLLGQRCQRYF